MILGAAILLVALLLVWHVVTPTPPAHTFRLSA